MILVQHLTRQDSEVSILLLVIDGKSRKFWLKLVWPQATASQNFIIKGKCRQRWLSIVLFIPGNVKSARCMLKLHANHLQIVVNWDIKLSRWLCSLFWFLKVFLYVIFPFGLLNILGDFLFYKCLVVDDLNDAEVFTAVIDCNSLVAAIFRFNINNFDSIVCLDLLLLKVFVVLTFLFILFRRCA